jgi:hypothetical protein
MGTLHDLNPRRYEVTTVITVERVYVVGANSEEEAASKVHSIIEASKLGDLGDIDKKLRRALGDDGFFKMDSLKEDIIEIEHCPSSEVTKPPAWL